MTGWCILNDLENLCFGGELNGDSIIADDNNNNNNSSSNKNNSSSSKNNNNKNNNSFLDNNSFLGSFMNNNNNNSSSSSSNNNNKSNKNRDKNSNNNNNNNNRDKNRENRDKDDSTAINNNVFLATTKTPRMVGRLPRHQLEWTLEHSNTKGKDTKRRNAAAVTDGKRFIYLVGGYDGKTALSTIEQYDCAIKKWRTFKGELKHSVSGLAALMLGDMIMTFGGFHGSRRQSSCYSYDVKSEKSNELPKMIHKRGGCASVVLDGSVACVIGGHDGLVHLNCGETLDMKNVVMGDNNNKNDSGDSNHNNLNKPSWSILNDEMNEARSNFGAVAIKDVIYVVGGENDTGVLNSVEKYSKGKWSMLPAMKLPRRYCAVAAIEHFLIVMGGDDGDKEDDATCVYDSCLLFNTFTDEWYDEAATMPHMHISRTRASAVVMEYGGSKVHIIGGSGKKKRFLSSIETCDVFHTVPMPPAVEYPPEMITPVEIIVNNSNDRKNKRTKGNRTKDNRANDNRINDKRLVQDSYALTGWINETNTSVNMYKVACKTVVQEVNDDFLYKEKKITERIIALEKIIQKSRTSRDSFLNDMEKLTYNWFDLQETRLGGARAIIPKRSRSGGSTDSNIQSSQPIGVRTPTSQSRRSEGARTLNSQPRRVENKVNTVQTPEKDAFENDVLKGLLKNLLLLP